LNKKSQISKTRQIWKFVLFAGIPAGIIAVAVATRRTVKYAVGVANINANVVHKIKLY
jgi:hypothetical protein